MTTFIQATHIPTITATSGNTLILLININTVGVSIISVEDNKKNIYTEVASFYSYKIYIAKNIKGGNITISVNFSRRTYGDTIRVLEFNGVNTFDAIALDNVTLVNGVNNISYSVTNTQQPALLLYWEVYSAAGGGSQTWDPSFTLAYSGFQEYVYYKNVSSIGPQPYNKTMTVTLTAGVGYGSSLSSFYYEAPPPKNPCIQIRGKCKLRGNIKIQ
jgi:hypothetical protein